MIIDNHTHANTEEELIELIKSMDNNSIDKSIVLHIPKYKLKEQIKNIMKYKNRLYLVGSIQIENNHKFYEDFIELHNAVIQKEIYGVKLYLGYEHFYANDKRCDIIYQMCEKHNIPLIFHTGDTWIGENKTSIVKYANPIYIDEIAVKYPKMKIVISHMGNPIWINETAELVFKNKNIFTDFSGMLTNKGKTKSMNTRIEHYNKKTEEKIIDLINYVGDSKKIMLGSDYGYFTQNIYVEFINKLLLQNVITDSEFEDITYKNAVKVYGI
ncbi:MAG: hypothetical protein Kow0068_07750 [Marinilabiliales bacterium]